MKKEIKKIRRTSGTGLWGSVGMVILTALFHFVLPYRFYPTAITARWMLIAATVLAVLAVSMAVLAVHKNVPALRQAEGLEKKLGGYADHVGQLYIEMLVVVVLVCFFSIISAQNMLLVFAMLCTLVLIMAYPNIYRIQVDLGLTDDEMRSLFGDKFISNESKD